MAFINEYVSEDDIQRYGLEELKRKYDSWGWRDGRPPGFSFAWTIDRDEGTYFFPVHHVHEVGQSGRSQPTTKEICVLGHHGKRITFTLDRAPGSSAMLTDSPFKVIWDLIAFDISSLSEKARKQAVEQIKAALLVYGHRGAHRQVPNTVIQFNF